MSRLSPGGPALQDPDPTEELAWAEQTLARAYEQARNTGYLPGSDAMLALQHAELAYQQVRARAPRHGTEHAKSGDDSLPIDVTIDLTDRGPTKDFPTHQGPTHQGPAHQGPGRQGPTDQDPGDRACT